MHAAQVEVLQYWGDSLLRAERFARTRRVTVGPADRSDFPAPLDTPTALLEGGLLRGHGDAGETEIAVDAGTDVLVDVGDHTFRVRAVAPERPVAGGVLAHVDWLFIAFCVVFAVFLMLGIVFAVFCVLVVLLFEKIVALLTALGLQALLALLPAMPPPSPPPAPVIVATIEPPPAPPAPPPRPFFVKPTPTPTPMPRPEAPRLTPIPMGDIPSRKLARVKKVKAPLEEEIVESALVGELTMLSAIESPDGAESSGILGALTMTGPEELGLRGGLGVRGAGTGELGGLRGGGGVGSLRASEDEVDDGGVEGGVVYGVLGGVPEDEVVDLVEGGEPGGVVGGVAGGVVGGVAGGVVGGVDAGETSGVIGRLDGGVPGGVVGGVVGGEPGGVVGGIEADGDGLAGRGEGVGSGYGRGGGGRAVGIGRLESTPSRPRSEIDAAVTRSMDSFRECYERELASRPGLEERLVLLITVEPSGTVSRARILSTRYGIESLNECVLEKVKALDFPSRDGSATTTPVSVVFVAD